MYTEHGASRLAALSAAGAFAQSVDVLDAIEGLGAADFRAFIANTNPFETTDALLGDVLFPNVQQDSLDFRYVMGGSNAAIMADVSSHLGEAPIVGRRVAATRAGSIPAIKQKKLLDAETLIRLQQARGAALQRAVDEVFNDTTAVRRAVLSTVEYLRMQALAYGIVTLDWLGVQGAFDYGVPAAQKEVLTGTALWSDPASNPLADLERWQNALINNRGNRAGAVVTSRNVTNALRQHAKIRQAIYGVNSDRRATIGDVNALLQQEGLPVFIEYNQTAKRLNAAGAEVNTRFYPANRLTLIPDVAAVGQTMTAPTAEEALQGLADGRIAIDGDRVAVHVYVASQDPKGLMTLGVASKFPSLEAAEDMFMAQVLA